VNAQPNQFHRSASRRGKAPLVVLPAASVAGVVAIAVLIVLFVRRDGGEEAAPSAGEQQADQSGVPSSESLQSAEPVTSNKSLSPERVRAAVDAAVAANAALLDNPALLALMNSRGDVAGDPRQANPAESDDVRSARNWELHFLRGSTLENYARQLDHFGIELGVLLPGNKLVYAASVSKPKPQSRNGRADAEKRYYLTWRESEAQQADRELLARAGVPSEGLVILKFLPPALETQLAELEKQHAAGRPGAIQKTSFGVRVEGDGYALHVIEQKRK
jgi:hypothetical protein